MILLFKHDRSDGKYVTSVNDLNRFVPYLAPGRIESQLYWTITMDVSKIQNYIAKKKEEGLNVNFNSAIIAAIVRMVAMRPHINRFIVGKKVYQRDKIEIGHIGMVEFSDDSIRVVDTAVFDPSANLETVSKEIKDQVSVMKSGEITGSNKQIAHYAHKPWWYVRIAIGTVKILHRLDKVPKSKKQKDPFKSSVFVSNLGSLKSIPPFHHLLEWGTNSVFICIGSIYDKVVPDTDGKIKISPNVDLTLTVDDRITDGRYFTTCIQALRDIIENPECLDSEYRPNGN